ncbi:ricin B-like lectin R40G2 [Selaginella moellendorffii]|nr:ricin B-like lectin R40G2 [Selaginella moellendorffii]|eukprot:XP_002990026.2 ricin B-like lectin R40G2 [Selaginella moellendorffii]
MAMLPWRWSPSKLYVVQSSSFSCRQTVFRSPFMEKKTAANLVPLLLLLVAASVRLSMNRAEASSSASGPYCAAQLVSSANLTLCVTASSRVVVMSRCADGHSSQMWIRRPQPREGHSAILIVNYSSRLALQHHAVGNRITCGSSSQGLNSSLWMMDGVGERYLALRTYQNSGMVLDIYHGDHTHGGVRENSFLITHPYDHRDNQQWRFINPAC